MPFKEARFPKIQPFLNVYPRRQSDTQVLSIIAELSIVLSAVPFLIDQQERDLYLEVVNSIDSMSYYRDLVMTQQTTVCKHPDDAKDPFCRNPYCNIGLFIREHGIYTRKYDGWKYHAFYGRAENDIRPKTLRTVSEFSEDLSRRLQLIKEASVPVKRVLPSMIPSTTGTYLVEDPDLAILTHDSEFEQLSTEEHSDKNTAIAEEELRKIYGSEHLNIILLKQPIRRSTYEVGGIDERIDILSVLNKEAETLPFYMMPVCSVGYQYRDRIFIRGLRYWFSIQTQELSEHPASRSYEFYFENQFDFPTFVYDQSTNYNLHASSYLTLDELRAVIDRLSTEEWLTENNTLCEHLTFHVNTRSKRCYVIDRFGERISYRGLLLQYRIPKNPLSR